MSFKQSRPIMAIFLFLLAQLLVSISQAQSANCPAGQLCNGDTFSINNVDYNENPQNLNAKVIIGGINGDPHGRSFRFILGDPSKPPFDCSQPTFLHNNTALRCSKYERFSNQSMEMTHGIEVVTIGLVGGDFCAALDKNENDASADQPQCDNDLSPNRNRCVCFRVEYYCPTDDDETAFDTSACGDFMPRNPPGRGTGSGGSP